MIQLAAPVFMLCVWLCIPLYCDLRRGNVDTDVRPGEQGSGPIDPAMDYIAIGVVLFILCGLIFTSWALEWLGVYNPGQP